MLAINSRGRESWHSICQDGRVATLEQHAQLPPQVPHSNRLDHGPILNCPSPSRQLPLDVLYFPFFHFRRSRDHFPLQRKLHFSFLADGPVQQNYIFTHTVPGGRRVLHVASSCSAHCICHSVPSWLHPGMLPAYLCHKEDIHNHLCQTEMPQPGD